MSRLPRLYASATVQLSSSSLLPINFPPHPPPSLLLILPSHAFLRLTYHLLSQHIPQHILLATKSMAVGHLLWDAAASAQHTEPCRHLNEMISGGSNASWMVRWIFLLLFSARCEPVVAMQTPFPPSLTLQLYLTVPQSTLPQLTSPQPTSDCATYIILYLTSTPFHPLRHHIIAHCLRCDVHANLAHHITSHALRSQKYFFTTDCAHADFKQDGPVEISDHESERHIWNNFGETPYPSSMSYPPQCFLCTPVTAIPDT